MGSRAASTALLVFLTPYLVAHLGQEGYGVWVVILAASGMAGLIDVGLTFAMGRFVSHATARGERSAIRRAATASTAGTLVLSVVVFAVGWLATPALVDLLNLSAGLRDDAAIALRAALVVVPVANLAGAFEGLLIGLDEVGVVAAIRLLNVVMVAAAIVAAVQTGHGIAGVGVAFAAAWGASLVVWVALARRRLGEGLLTREVRWRETLRELLRLGVPHQLSRIGLVGAMQYERFAVGALVTAAAAGRYGVASTLVVGVASLLSPAVLPLIPALTEVAVSRDSAGFAAAYDASLRWFTALVVGVYGALACAGLPLVIAWVGAGFHVSAGYLAVLAPGFALWTVANVSFTAGQAIGRPGLEGLAAGAAMAIYLGAAPLLLGVFGAPVAGVATAVGLAAGALLHFRLLRRGRPSVAVSHTAALLPVCAVALAVAAPAVLLNLLVVDLSHLSRLTAGAIALAESATFLAGFLLVLLASGYLPMQRMSMPTPALRSLARWADRRAIGRSAESPHRV